MNREERLDFVRSHRIAVFGVNRKNDGPAMTIVYSVMDGNDVLVSTMQARGKAKAVRRDPKVSLCILDEQWPPTYLQLFCNATIDTDRETVVTLSMAVSSLMAGQKMPESVRDATRERVIAERRIQLRLRPYATFESPPRHVYTPKDVIGLTHGLGTRLPWE